jgi:hypothetical protein
MSPLFSAFPASLKRLYIWFATDKPPVPRITDACEISQLDLDEAATDAYLRRPQRP